MPIWYQCQCYVFCNLAATDNVVIIPTCNQSFLISQLSSLIISHLINMKVCEPVGGIANTDIHARCSGTQG